MVQYLGQAGWQIGSWTYLGVDLVPPCRRCPLAQSTRVADCATQSLLWRVHKAGGMAAPDRSTRRPASSIACAKLHTLATLKVGPCVGQHLGRLVSSQHPAGTTWSILLDCSRPNSGQHENGVAC